MKNYINKIIVGVFGLALVFTAQSAFAANWNGASNDCKSISIVNATTNEGFGDPCWPSSSISADAGDTLNVRIYYHNTGTTTATNTRIKLSAPTGSSSTIKTFSGNISSDQGGLSLGTVTAKLSSSQTITFNSVKWYTENTNVTRTTLLNGQDGSEILDEGLDIGSIAPGWATQGSVVVSFHVSKATVEPQICKDISATNYGGPLPCVYPQSICKINNFSASPTSITKGDSSTLNWSTSNCSNVTITEVGNVSTSGNKLVYPTSSTVYTLKAYGSNGSLGDTDTVSVNVSSPSVMTGNLDASDSSCVIASGHSTCSIPFTWSTQNPEAVSSVTNNGSTVATGNSGSKTFSVKYGSSSYYLYNNSKLLDTENVSASCSQNSSWYGSYCKPVVTQVCSINNFSASPTSITKGDSSVLSWSTENCSTVTIYPTIGNTSNSGSRSVYPTTPTTYTITAYGSGSGTQTRTVTVDIQADQICRDTQATNYLGSLPCVYPQLLCKDPTATNYNGSLPCTYLQLCKDTSATNYNGALPCKYAEVSSCSISSFTSTDTTIEEGDSTILKWNTNGCSRVKISDVGDVDEDGTEKVYPDEDTTYLLTAYDSNGTTRTRSLKIYVEEDEDDEDDDDDEKCSIDSFTTSNAYINKGDSTNLKWKTTDCYNVSLSGVGSVDEDGNEIVYPYSTTVFTLKAYGDNGTKTKTLRINVNYNTYNNPIVQPIVPIYNVNVITTVATNVSQTGAQVNGIITSSNSDNANVYFEYGTNINLGNRTSSRSTNGNTNFSDYLTNLSPNTIYYFQAVSDNSNGISRGAIEVFKTSSNVNTNVVYGNTNTTKVIREVVQGTTVYGSTSPVVLKIENRYQMLGVGDVIEYTVFYKNISSSTLRNPMVQVFVPKGITLTNISQGTYSEDDRTLSVPIGDLVPGEEGVIYLQAVVDSIDTSLAQIVTTAVLIYTNPNGAQENAMAYVLNNPGSINTNLLGASAFFGGLFNFGLIGWLIIIILILLIILIARSLYSRRSVVTTTTHSTVNK